MTEHLTEHLAEHLLDNPIWHSLVTLQAEQASSTIQARRFAPQVAPFGAVAAPTAQAEAELIELVEPGEQICVAFVAPPFSAAWKLEKQGEVLQMVCETRLPADAPDPEIQRMTDADVLAMLELTALVYPAYFRQGAPSLGAYFGIYQNGRLAAMAGERFRFAGWREISAVCTHPDFAGRGFAQRLVRHLSENIWQRGETPFLHADVQNTRAISLYERLGFKPRRTFPLWLVRRQQ